MYYLLRHSCNASRMTYLSRTTPLRHCRAALLSFDDGLRHAFQVSLGFSLSPNAWAQAVLPLRHGGLGLQSAAAVADAAYLGSQVATTARCMALWPDYAPAGVDPHADVVSAVGRCNHFLSDAMAFRPRCSRGWVKSCATTRLLSGWLRRLWPDGRLTPALQTSVACMLPRSLGPQHFGAWCRP